MNQSQHKKANIAANWLLTAERTVVFTGAGMSTESNVPDFRSRSGWWKKIDPLTVATTDAFANNYQLFREFYMARMRALEEIKPHDGHHILALWEQRKLIQAIATQNVDGLHHAAGSKNVYELHGSIATVRCHECRELVEKDAFIKGDQCPQCRGKLRPNVVLFGEMLPEKAWQQALQSMEVADLVIVIGTSLAVYPANQLPNMTSGKTIYINAEIAEEINRFDLKIEGKAKEILKNINSFVKE